MQKLLNGWLRRLGMAPDEAARAAALRAIEARHVPVLMALDVEIARIEAEIGSCELGAMAIIAAEHEIARKQLLREACQASFEDDLAAALGGAAAVTYQTSGRRPARQTELAG